MPVWYRVVESWSRVSGTGSRLQNGLAEQPDLVGDRWSVFVDQQSLKVYLPSRGNHKLVFHNAGFTDVGSYTYWDATNRKVDMQKMLYDLEEAPEK